MHASKYGWRGWEVGLVVVPWVEPNREAAMTEPGGGARAEKRGTSEICHVEARSLLPDCGGATFPKIARVRRKGSRWEYW
jgi:hypothetical protein